MIASFDEFLSPDEPKKKKCKNTDMGCIDYAEYIAEKISGNRYIGKSRIDGSPIYYGTSGNAGTSGKQGTGGQVYSEPMIMSGLTEKQLLQSDDKYNWHIQNNQLVAELNNNWKQGIFNNGTWFNGNYGTDKQQTVQDNFGQWSKEHKTLKPFEKWMIGIGLGSLIISIVTVIVMVVI